MTIAKMIVSIFFFCYSHEHHHLLTGYSTHIVGKWHLGFFKWAYTPLYRGFDSFYGFYSGAANHFSHKKEGIRDLHDNMTPVKNKKGVYSTRLYAEVFKVSAN